MYKKITLIFFVTIMVMGGSGLVLADESVPIMNLNDSHLYFVNNVEPIVLNGTVLVPLREFTEILGGKVTWNQADKTVDIEIPHAIASNTQQKLYLYPFECSKSTYQGFILESNGQRKYFDWTAQASREIQLACLDINNDDRDEIVVILYQGGGTDVAQYEIHILDMETFEEIPVENPLDYINREVRTSITQTSTDLLIDIKIGDQEYLCKRDLPGFSAIDNIVFGNIIRFELENQRICCSVPGMYCIPGYVGDFRVYYKYDAATQSMKAFKVVFEDYGK